MRAFIHKIIVTLFFMLILGAPEAAAWKKKYFTPDEIRTVHNAYGSKFKNFFIDLFRYEDSQDIVAMGKNLLQKNVYDANLFRYTHGIKNKRKRLVVLLKGKSLFDCMIDRFARESFQHFFKDFNGDWLQTQTFIEVISTHASKLFMSNMDDFAKVDVILALMSNPRPLAELPTYIDILVDNAPKLLNQVETGADYALIMAALARSNRPLNDTAFFIDALEKSARRLQTARMTSYDLAYVMAALIRSHYMAADVVSVIDQLAEHTHRLFTDDMDGFAEAKLTEMLIDLRLAPHEIENVVTDLQSHAWKLRTREMDDFHYIAVMRMIAPMALFDGLLKDFVFQILAEMNNSGHLDLPSPHDLVVRGEVNPYNPEILADPDRQLVAIAEIIADIDEGVWDDDSDSSDSDSDIS